MYYVLAMGVPAAGAAKHQINPSPFCVSRLLLLPQIKEMRVYIYIYWACCVFIRTRCTVFFIGFHHGISEQLSFPSFWFSPFCFCFVCLLFPPSSFSIFFYAVSFTSSTASFMFSGTMNPNRRGAPEWRDFFTHCYLIFVVAFFPSLFLYPFEKGCKRPSQFL